MLYPHINFVLYSGRGTSPFLVCLVLSLELPRQNKKGRCIVQNNASLNAGRLHFLTTIFEEFRELQTGS
jgi:hypothetical protein